MIKLYFPVSYTHLDVYKRQDDKGPVISLGDEISVKKVHTYESEDLEIAPASNNIHGAFKLSLVRQIIPTLDSSNLSEISFDHFFPFSIEVEIQGSVDCITS